MRAIHLAKEYLPYTFLLLRSFFILRFLLRYFSLVCNSVVVLWSTTFFFLVRITSTFLLVFSFVFFVQILNIELTDMFLKLFFLVTTFSTHLNRFHNCRHHTICIQSSIVHLRLSQWSPLPVWHPFTLANFRPKQILAYNTQTQILRFFVRFLGHSFIVMPQVNKFFYLLVKRKLWQVLL